MSVIIDKAVYISANNINKTLKQAIIDGDLSGGGGSGGGTELFNHTVYLNGSSTSLTGLNYFCAPVAGLISNVKIQIWTKNGIASGSLSVDIKKNTTPANAGMASMLTTQPSINFATAVDYAQASGVLSTASFNAGDFIRLDVTSIPVGFVGTVTILVQA